MSFKNNKRNFDKSLKSGQANYKADHDIGVGSNEPRDSLIDKIDILVQKNFAVPNIYRGEGKQGKKCLSAIESLNEDVSPKRLYHLAKEYCQGMMLNCFNAF
ncbi:hypothetical protein DMUE_4062 [Dictyocoela muelleri]|nr:hypothetical protein DMUE_4062 [Dictyocoela muelleri]